MEPLHGGEAGQMQGHACQKSRACHGRAGRKIAEFFMKGIIKRFFQCIVNTQSIVCGFLYSKPGRRRLNDNVIRFIYHNRNGPVFAYYNGTMFGHIHQGGRDKMLGCG